MRNFVSNVAVSELRRLLVLFGIVAGLLALSIGCGESKSGETDAKTDAVAAEEQAADQTTDQTMENTTDQALAKQTDEPVEKANQTRPEKKTEPKAPTNRAVTAKKQEPKAVRTRTIEIPAGVDLVIELQETIETGQSQTGDHFRATLIDALVVADKTVFGAGAEVTGRVENAVASGRLKTDAELVLSILEIDGVPVITDVIEDKAASHASRNKKLIGGGAIVGGIIGAIKGKNVKGAIVGAAAGAAAGTGAAVLTGKKNLKYETGTLLQFTLAESVRVEVEK